MTVDEYIATLADDCHDWIDGDDPVGAYQVEGNTIFITFESGVVLRVEVNEVEL